MEARVGVVVLSRNTSEYAKNCFLTLSGNVKVPFEFVLINNGSDEANTRVLRKLSVENESIYYIENKENAGYPAGMNQGIRFLQTRFPKIEYFALLNDDLIIGEDFIASAIKVFEENVLVGMVTPMTNYASHKDQNVEHHGGRKTGKIVEMHNLIMVSPIIHKRVINRVGLLDENFNLGGYEDNDYSLRVKLAGYKIVLDGTSFVYHYGSRANRLLPQNYWDNLEKNKVYFREKWGLSGEDLNSDEWYKRFFDYSCRGRSLDG